MQRGTHPKSLANLTREGRTAVYGENKKNRKLSVTPTGWEGLQALADAFGCPSVSDFVEQIGRGMIPVGDESVIK